MEDMLLAWMVSLSGFTDRKWSWSRIADPSSNTEDSPKVQTGSSKRSSMLIMEPDCVTIAIVPLL